jgi:hypothetical protein
MPKVLMIIARDNRKLYTYVCSEFEGLGTDIEVVLDRRHAERRGSAAPSATERRRADRRAYKIEEDLRGIGWALVRRDLPTGPRPWTRPPSDGPTTD